MMYIRATGILLLVLFVSCKWWYKAEAEVEIRVKVVREDPVVVAEKAAEEVSKATGKGVEEVKTLSKEELGKIAKDVDDNAKVALQDSRNFSNGDANAKKTSELIKEIKDSAEKFDLAFKTLVGAGFTGVVSDVVMANMNSHLKRLSLVDNLAGIVENSGSIEDAKKAVGAFGGDTGSCMSDISESRGHRQNKGSEQCMKSLMGNVSDLFNGVYKELRDVLEEAPEKFKEALGALRRAAWDLSSASSLVKNKISS
ncbi:hypothetical protein [Borrelia sp. P9F1]|uniref:hypothetical protein n=1 Tax=Borrelia sp. P9F1 TaxID=3058374 RepID=UPI00264A3FD3|nr:hypothetical protein [Borrelia sp. P9F1]WKC58724.1 hypothetical protein QYZ68_05835 [Borrelia sp. P9F1]